MGERFVDFILKCGLAPAVGSGGHVQGEARGPGLPGARVIFTSHLPLRRPEQPGTRA